ncbi:MAG: hypothetical protein P8Z74_14815, partial [Acidobacteriota bacterium]
MVSDSMNSPATHSKDPIQRLVDEFRRLPGIGPKSAQRLVFHLLKRPDEEAKGLAEALIALKENLGLCGVCNNISDVDP